MNEGSVEWQWQNAWTWQYDTDNSDYLIVYILIFSTTYGFSKNIKNIQYKSKNGLKIL